MASIQRKAANDFTATFPPETVGKWQRMVQEWEANSSHPNPYVSNDHGKFFRLTLIIMTHIILLALKVSEIRLQLAEKEAVEVERGQRAPHQVSASVFIRMGLELEDQQ